MGSGMSSYRRRRPRDFVLDPSKGMLPLLGLQVLLEYGCAGSARPPATAALLAANVLVFLRPGALDGILPKKAYVALNPNIFFKFRDLKTFFLSPFYHVNEAHLFCNMTSLLWMGIGLETSMGSAEFASMVAALLGLSQGAMLVVSKGLSLLGEDAPYYEEFCIGFSGVLFGMKAVTMSARSDDLLHLPLPGMVIPAKYAVWAELFLVRALMPNTSFVGHLGGILAGYVYLWLKGSLNRRGPGPGPFNRLGPGSFNRPAGPLSRLISCGTRAMALPVKFAQELMSSVSVLVPKGHVTGRRGVGCCEPAARGCWICSSCTDYNSIATDICERCSTMREDCAFSWGQHHQPSCNRELTVEELRLRRVHRFDM